MIAATYALQLVGMAIFVAGLVIAVRARSW